MIQHVRAYMKTIVYINCTSYICRSVVIGDKYGVNIAHLYKSRLDEFTLSVYMLIRVTKAPDKTWSGGQVSWKENFTLINSYVQTKSSLKPYMSSLSLM
jgi:hypothetical protein